MPAGRRPALGGRGRRGRMTCPRRQLGMNGVRRAERTSGGHHGAAGRASLRPGGDAKTVTTRARRTWTDWSPSTQRPARAVYRPGGEPLCMTTGLLTLGLRQMRNPCKARSVREELGSRRRSSSGQESVRGQRKVPRPNACRVVGGVGDRGCCADNTDLAQSASSTYA